MATAIKRQSNALSTYRARAASVARETVSRQQHTLFAVGSGFLIGFAEQKGWKIPTVVGMHPAALYGLGALVAAYYIKNRQGRRVAESAADGLLTVASYIGGSRGVNALFSGAAGVSGWGEEIIETGSF